MRNKKQNQTNPKKKATLKDQLSRYKFATPNKDLILKRKSWDGIAFELNSK